MRINNSLDEHMFQKNASGGEQDAETIIGAGVKVEGDVKGAGNILVEGHVNGTLTTEKDVTVGEQAEIKANISAANASIGGRVHGSVAVSGHLTIRSTANITGDIATKTIAVESGARINGHLKMGEEHASAKTE